MSYVITYATRGDVLLTGLWSLLTSYLPALLSLGYRVRQCAWEGQATGTVKGLLAKEVLQHCLLLHVHLMDDWDARLEYTRTMALALLQWTPWHSSVPGCLYVEESCEALLGRVVTRCRRHHYLTGFQSTFHLFLTTTVADRRPHHTHGSVRADLVTLFTARLRSLVARRSSGVPYAKLTWIRNAVWQADWPTTCCFPSPVPITVNHAALTRVFQGALVCLTTRRGFDRQVDDLLRPLCRTVDSSEEQRQQYARSELRRWGRERAQRRRVGRTPRRVPQTPATAGSSSSSSTSDSTDTEDTGLDNEAEPDPPSGDSDDGDVSDGLGSVGDLESIHGEGLNAWRVV